MEDFSSGHIGWVRKERKGKRECEKVELTVVYGWWWRKLRIMASTDSLQVWKKTSPLSLFYSSQLLKLFFYLTRFTTLNPVSFTLRWAQNNVESMKVNRKHTLGFLFPVNITTFDFSLYKRILVNLKIVIYFYF